MKQEVFLTGIVVSGKGQAAFFTGLDWVQSQCAEKLGFRPYPGTLNLQVTGESLRRVGSLLRKESPGLVPPNPEFCEARVFPVTIGGIPGAIVMPADKVRVHGRTIIEVLAPVRLKTALNLVDGDRVNLMPGRRTER